MGGGRGREERRGGRRWDPCVVVKRYRFCAVSKGDLDAPWMFFLDLVGGIGGVGEWEGGGEKFGGF